MKKTSLVLALLLAPAGLAAQQSPAGSALLKSDLVRYLTGTTYSKPEIAAIVRRSCLAFVPTARDRSDLRELGATKAIFHEIDVCVRNDNVPPAERQTARATRTTPAPRTAAPQPPLPLTLAVSQPAFTATTGSVAYIDVDLHRGNAPEIGKRLVLRGTQSIPGDEGDQVTAVTDDRGHATFAVSTGTHPGSYHLTVATADGSPLAGNDALVLTTRPATAARAELLPSPLVLEPGAHGTRQITAIIIDPFGNPVPGQSVQLRLPARTGLAPETEQTSDSGSARFEVSLSALRIGDTLAVVMGDRTLATLPVSAGAQVATQLLEAQQLLAQGKANAQGAYDSVLAIDPDNANALIGRGYLRSWAGNFAGAQQDFETAMHTDSARSAALTGLGVNSLRRGSYQNAAEQFQQALRIEPNSPAAATGLAYAELWRYDRQQAALRARALSTPQPVAYPAEAAEQFRAGIEQVVRRNLLAAERDLSTAVEKAPAWPEAYYNRALVFEAEGRSQRAAADYRKYLELRPNAPNRDAVARRIDALSRTPVGALARGLIIPGLGQFYTHQPVLGGVVMAATAGGTALAVYQKRTLETRTFMDKLRNTITYQVPVYKHPNLAAGIAVAGAAWLGGAIEAAMRAGGSSGDVPLPSLNGGSTRTAARFQVYPVVSLAPSGPAFGAGISVPLR